MLAITQQVARMESRLQTKLAGNRDNQLQVRNAPINTSVNINSSMPRFLPTNDGIRVRHREFVTDISAPGLAGWGLVEALSLNPGLGTMGPWLSTIAPNFELYHVNALRYIFVSSVPTDTAGRFYMAIDYDSADSPPETKPQMMSNLAALGSSIWSSGQMVYQPLKESSQIGKYTRDGSVSGDIKTYDCGKLYIATETAYTASPGDLYVEYDVTLRLPQIPTSLADAYSARIINNNVAANILTSGDYTLTGNADIAHPQSVGSSGMGSWVFTKPGEYLLTFAINTTIDNTSNDISPTWTVYSGSGEIHDMGYAQPQKNTSTPFVGVYLASVVIQAADSIVRLSLSHLGTVSTIGNGPTLRISAYGYGLF